MANIFGDLNHRGLVWNQGKRVLVTGVSVEIGVETARSLVAYGAQVVGAARDLAKRRVIGQSEGRPGERRR